MSHLLLLGNGEAIVIDCGSKSCDTLLKSLDHYRVERIRRLIVSHCHDDHAGAAPSVLTHFEDRVDEIWFLKDVRLFASELWSTIDAQVTSGALLESQLIRLEATDKPRVIFCTSDGRIELSVASPSYHENLTAEKQSNPNATSAILMLRAYQSSIVFAGDSEIGQWKRLRSQLKHPIACDVLSVPHHGGAMDDSSADDLAWLYTEAIRCETAVVSVGTSNQHGHPREDVITALRANGANVLCTQITRQCCANLESLRPGVLTPHPTGRSSATESLTSGQKSRDLACASTVTVNISATGITIAQASRHAAAVDALASRTGQIPLCRRACAATPGAKTSERKCV